MKLHIITQYLENYGAHNWDGEGACPQQWKYKGGQDYFIPGVDSAAADEELAALVDSVRSKIEWRDEGSEQYIIGYGLVPDDFLTEFERSQLEYEGSIAYPATVIDNPAI